MPDDEHVAGRVTAHALHGPQCPERFVDNKKPHEVDLPKRARRQAGKIHARSQHACTVKPPSGIRIRDARQADDKQLVMRAQSHDLRWAFRGRSIARHKHDPQAYFESIAVRGRQFDVTAQTKVADDSTDEDATRRSVRASRRFRR